MEKIPNNEKQFEKVLNDFLGGEIDKATLYLKEHPELVSEFCRRVAYSDKRVVEPGLQGLGIFVDHLMPSDEEALPQDIKNLAEEIVRRDVDNLVKEYGHEILIKKYSDLISYLLQI